MIFDNIKLTFIPRVRNLTTHLTLFYINRRYTSTRIFRHFFFILFFYSWNFVGSRLRNGIINFAFHMSGFVAKEVDWEASYRDHSAVQKYSYQICFLSKLMTQSLSQYKERIKLWTTNSFSRIWSYDLCKYQVNVKNMLKMVNRLSKVSKNEAYLCSL